ncbi:hypothetical protein SESBI_21811 [Sesbania bispinosa]|nr:hypothetical protein SESBI_21811 [Sesbania bispinosa]
MENLARPSPEEEDLLARSTKKVKLIIENVESKENKGSPGASSNNPAPIIESMETKNPPELVKDRSAEISKPSYKDMVICSNHVEEDPEDILRAVNEELFPDHLNSDEDMPCSNEFNPNPEVKIT